MARPPKTEVVSSQQSWDAAVNANLDVLFDGPLPAYEIATVTALLALDPADYDNCIVATADTNEYWQSNTAAWVLIGKGHLNANGARDQRILVVQVVDLEGQASPYTVAAVAPAGSRRLYHSGRLIEAATGTTLTSLDLGDGSDADRFANDLALALNTTFTAAQATADPEGWSAAAHNFVVTGNGLAGNFTAGQIRLVTVYEIASAPTS